MSGHKYKVHIKIKRLNCLASMITIEYVINNQYGCVEIAMTNMELSFLVKIEIKDKIILQTVDYVYDIGILEHKTMNQFNLINGCIHKTYTCEYIPTRKEIKQFIN